VLLAEVDAEGGKVRLVARRHNISESLLCNWRSARKAADGAMGAPENVEFIPAGISEGPASRAILVVVPTAPERELESVPATAPCADKTGPIDITLPNGTRLAVDATPHAHASPKQRRPLRSKAPLFFYHAAFQKSDLSNGSVDVHSNSSHLSLPYGST